MKRPCGPTAGTDDNEQVSRYGKPKGFPYFFVLLFIMFFCSVSFAGEVSVTAKAALVYDVTSKKILYSKNPDRRLPAASTIKIMTAILAAENYSKTKRCKASAGAFKGLTDKVYLKQGTSYSIDDLLNALLLSSSNDAANVLAETIAGSIDDFVVVMNRKAVSLGADKTKFANPSGLTDKENSQYTTAYDLARIMRRFLTYPRLFSIMKQPSAVIRGSDGRWIFLKNHNKLLKRYPGVIIGKTGYTLLARHCFVGYSTVPKKRYIFVIIGSEKPWRDMSKLLYAAGCVDKIIEK